MNLIYAKDGDGSEVLYVANTPYAMLCLKDGYQVFWETSSQDYQSLGVYETLESCCVAIKSHFAGNRPIKTLMELGG